jgi:NitT/TauT family transport system substrate-binding protein
MSVVGLTAWMFGSSGPGAAQTRPLQPLHVIVLPLEVTAAAYYAQDLHLFTRAGLDVTIQSLGNGGAITAGVVSGAADIGSANPISVEVAHEKGLPVAIIGGASFQDAKTPTNGLLAVSATSPYHTAKDLNGKIIAVSGLGNIADLGVRNWLDQNGGDSTTVKFIESPMQTMAPAMATGRIDGADIDASSFDAAPKGQLRLLGSTFDSFGPRWVQSTWFTSRDFEAKHPDIVKKFMSAIREASVWANAQPADAIRVFAKYSKYDVHDLELAVRPPFVTKPITPDQLQTTIDVAKKYGVLKKGFPASELISPLNDER